GRAVVAAVAEAGDGALALENPVGPRLPLRPVELVDVGVRGPLEQRGDGPADDVVAAYERLEEHPRVAGVEGVEVARVGGAQRAGPPRVRGTQGQVVHPRGDELFLTDGARPEAERAALVHPLDAPYDQSAFDLDDDRERARRPPGADRL